MVCGTVTGDGMNAKVSWLEDESVRLGITRHN